MSNHSAEKPFQLVRSGEFAELREILIDINLNVINQEKQNLLHEAIAYNRSEIGEFLIKEGIQLNHQDKHGQTPLHYAATRNQLELGRLIVENGGDVALADEHGNTALWSAVHNARGYYKLVELLLKFGASPTHKNKSGRSPLDFARQIEDEHLVGILTRGF